jgi:hypothetical protein
MGRMYVLSNTLAAVTAAETLFEIGALTNTVCVVHRISLTQSTSEADDSALISYGTYTASGTGTSITANIEALDPGDAAFGGTAEDNHTVDITTGEIVLGREGISLLAGYQKIFTPEERPVVPGAGFFGFNLDSAITSVTLVYEVVFEEIG